MYLARGWFRPGVIDVQEIAVRFLKKEGFYLAIVILVAAMAWLHSVRSLQGREESRRGAVTLDQRELRFGLADVLRSLVRRNPREALLPAAVTALELLLLVGGTGAVLGVFFVRVMRGRLIPPVQGRAPIWSLWDVLKVAALYVLGTSIFRGIFPTDRIQAFGMPGDWLADIFARVLLVGVIIHVVQIEKEGRLSDLGVPGAGVMRNVKYGVLAFLVVQPFLRLIEAAQFWWSEALPVQEPVQALFLTQSSWVLALGTFTAVIAAPVSEEMLFRAYLQPALQRWAGAAMGLLLSATFFAAAHMDLYAMPSLFVLGLALGYLYYRTQSLVAPVTLHLAYNGMAMLTIFASRSLMSGVR